MKQKLAKIDADGGCNLLFFLMHVETTASPLPVVVFSLGFEFFIREVDAISLLGRKTPVPSHFALISTSSLLLLLTR